MWCQRQLVQLASVIDEIYEAGAALWAVAPQAVEINAQLKERRKLNFPLLADPNLETIRAWGLFDLEDEKGRLIPYPATVIVNRQREIVWSHVGKTTRDRPTPDELLAAVPPTDG